MPTGKQIRAARALAGWDIKELAKQAALSWAAVQNIETGAIPKPKTEDRIIKAFCNVGVEFTDNEGVRKRPQGVEIFEGPERFHDFTEFIYNHLKKNGGDVCISAVDEGLFLKYRKNPVLYRKRMKKLVDSGKVKVRILATESTFSSVFAEYKWQKEQQSGMPSSFYAFGNCLALISFAHDPAPYVVLLKSGPFAEAYRHAFNIAWDNASAPPKTQDGEA